MAKIYSKYGSGVLPAPIPVAQEVLSAKAKVTLTTGQLALNNVLSMVVLPADCVPVGYVLNSGDLDSNGTPLIQLGFGVLNADETAIATSLITGSTIAQAGGIVLHTASKAAYDALGAITSSDKDRMIGVVISTAAATAQAGFVEVELLYKAV